MAKSSASSNHRGNKRDNSDMKYRVKLQKNQIAEAWVTIEANNDQEAVDGAMAEAGNCKVDWNYVDYDFEALEVTEVTESEKQAG